MTSITILYYTRVYDVWLLSIGRFAYLKLSRLANWVSHYATVAVMHVQAYTRMHTHTHKQYTHRWRAIINQTSRIYYSKQ